MRKLIVATLIGAATVAFPAAASSSNPPKVKCSTAGLRLVVTVNGTKRADTVQHLRARAVSCFIARDVAEDAAETLLSKNRVADRIDGFKVLVGRVNPGRTPAVDNVRAVNGGSTITFRLT